MRRLLLILVASLAVAACGGSKKDDETSAQPTAAATDPPPGKVTVTGALGKKPTIKVTPDNPTPPGKLVKVDLHKGKGPAAKAGETVSVQYVGALYRDNTVFDNSWDRGKPFPFQLGQGQVIPGWDAGVKGMKVGGRRELVIPPDQAYGAQGSGSSIGPNETLVFVVDLVKIKPAAKKK
jgi:peptidylprolyl isomerase